MTIYEISALLLGFAFGFLWARERNQAKDNLINRMADSAREQDEKITYYKKLVKDLVEENAAMRSELLKIKTVELYNNAVGVAVEDGAQLVNDSGATQWSNTVKQVRTRKKK